MRVELIRGVTPNGISSNRKRWLLFLNSCTVLSRLCTEDVGTKNTLILSL